MDGTMDGSMGMMVYSLLLGLGVAAAAPWWGWRMLRSGRYREGLGGRLGRVPTAVREAVSGKRVVWVHAVSVGEVLAVARLVEELETRLGEDWCVAVSTTTATGQRIARERFTGPAVFFFPLDFGFAVRAWMRVLRPRLMVLVESELWPRLLWECERAGVPVAVVNARMSDRSFGRAMRVRRVWGGMGRQVRVFLAQGEETAGRLRRLGIKGERVRVVGNLKYDLGEVGENKVAGWVREVADGREVIVAGSTLPGKKVQALNEEEMVIQAWGGELRESGALLVLAPRHPGRFAEVEATAMEFPMLKASEAFRVETTSERLVEYPLPLAGYSNRGVGGGRVEIVLLDTLGDLAAVYAVADVAFVGGSLVDKGGHNPLEAARFGVPVVMGPSYENFREVVEGMREVGAIRILEGREPGEELSAVLPELLRDGRGIGERGRVFFEGQAGATGRTVEALVELMGECGV